MEYTVHSTAAHMINLAKRYDYCNHCNHCNHYSHYNQRNHFVPLR